MAAELNDGECGLTDGSIEGDWHFPSLSSLQQIGTDPPTIWEPGWPTDDSTMPGAPFSAIHSSFYLTSYIIPTPVGFYYWIIEMTVLQLRARMTRNFIFGHYVIKYLIIQIPDLLNYTPSLL